MVVSVTQGTDETGQASEDGMEKREMKATVGAGCGCVWKVT